uniref:Gypsy retrotransposon integrase-like protein 1 n=1 Tax=Latimeria chalumnae TaxID=7897 RepID=H3BG27_LATCH
MPESFDFSRPVDWPDWKQRFSRYKIATKLDKESREVQLCSLIYALGKEAKQIFRSFSFEEEAHKNDYKIVMEKLDEHFVPKRNVIHERARFHLRIQKQGETIEAFTRNLYELAESCEFGNTKNEQIRDRLVIGILDKELSQKLQLEPELTLEKAIQTACHSELVKGQEVRELMSTDTILNSPGAKTRFKETEYQFNLYTSVLQTIEMTGLRLNKDKCLLCQKQLHYLGHCIDQHGTSADPEKVRAISEMVSPTSVSELRRILGMVHYLGRYLPNLSEITHPLNELLKSNIAWYWGSSQEQAFNKVKDLGAEALVLAFYDPRKPTVVSADANSYGLGVLLQDHSGQLKPVAYCSRTLMDAETRYAQIEKECLASMWACKKFEKYLYGLDSFKLMTDHKPLIPLINSRDLDCVPIRCQQLLMRMMQYNPQAEYVPGKALVVADTLSRHPLTAIKPEVLEMVEEIEAYEDASFSSKPMSDLKIPQVKQVTNADAELKMVMCFVQNGWLKYVKNVPNTIKKYFSERSSLIVFKGLLLHGNRIVIPTLLRPDVMERPHDSHQGITCHKHAKMPVWWPGIGKNILETIAACEFCQENKPTQRKEPLMTTPLPDKQHYLIMIDYFSRYLEIAHLPDTTSQATINRLKNVFARWGCPDELVTDNGPQFVGKAFKEFEHQYNFNHITSPHYPQVNGEAERAMQTAKRILKQKDPFYRATLLNATKSSPAQLIMGRQLRTPIPTLEKTLAPKWPDLKCVRQAARKAKAAYKFNFDKKNSTQQLPVLYPGDKVTVKLDDEQGWMTPATVQESHQTPRSYLIKTQDGMLRRNRRHLKFVTGQSNQGTDTLDNPSTPAETESVKLKKKKIYIYIYIY